MCAWVLVGLYHRPETAIENHKVPVQVKDKTYWPRYVV